MAVLLLLAAVAGCETPEYPAELAYPARTDLLVDRTPADHQPAGPHPSGQLDAALAALNGLGGQTYDPANLSADQRAQLQQALTDAFGTPGAPKVAGDDEIRTLADSMHLQPDQLAFGSRLFRRHCLQCHGLSGDGRGPTGLWVDPRPRDFRRGLFKFVSTQTVPKPRRADLLRTVRAGIDGTSMPSFALLGDEKQEHLIGYVIHLSLRGEVEYAVARTLLADGEAGLDGPIADDARAWLKTALRQWARAEAATVPSIPDEMGEEERSSPERLASMRRGYELFASASGAGCASCHADFGRQASYRYDIWGNAVRPADLTTGVYKGGKQTADLHHRIRCGIAPSGMPAAASLSGEQVLDLMRFVQALPYPVRLPPDVRGKVYGSGE